MSVCLIGSTLPTYHEQTILNKTSASIFIKHRHEKCTESEIVIDPYLHNYVHLTNITSCEQPTVAAAVGTKRHSGGSVPALSTARTKDC